MLTHVEPNSENIPGFFKPTINFKLSDSKFSLQSEEDWEIKVISNFLSDEDVIKLVNLFNSSTTFEEVSKHGIKGVFSEKGSVRTTMWSPELANQLTQKLDLNFITRTDQYSRTDAWQKVNKDVNSWKLVGFSPMLRFMRYEYGGEHYAHYDAAYIYPDSKYRTLKSVVIYLTTNTSGQTRFINDKQQWVKQQHRNCEDWRVPTDQNLVTFGVMPVVGKTLFFDHRLCHDVEKFIPASPNEVRMIIRGDLIFELND